MSPVSTPQSLRKLEIINEGYTENENMAESNFTESTAVMEYRIRLVEDVKLLTGENEMIVSEAKASLFLGFTLIFMRTNDLTAHFSILAH